MTARRLTPWLVGVLSLGIYGWTLCPTIFAGDAGELAAAAAAWGVAHPPGYPLWVLLGHLAAGLTPQEPALGTNILSALCAAGAAGFLAAAALRMRISAPLAAAAALAYALAPTAWSQAVITEVYALNQLLVAMLLFAWAAARDGEAWALPLAAYLLGLGMGNHPLVAVAGLPFLTLPWRELLRRLPMCVGWFFLGVSIYLLLPLRAAANPAIEWGALHSWSDLWNHVLRIQYTGDAPSGSVLVRGRVLLDLWRTETPLIVGLLAGGSLLTLWRGSDRSRAVALWLLLLASGPALAAALRYEDTFRDRTVVRVFFLSAFLTTYLLAALSAQELLRGRMSGRGRQAALLLLLCVGIGVQYARGVAHGDRSQSTLTLDYAEAVLRSLPPDSRVYAVGDNEVFGLAYARFAKGLRPDVELVDHSLNLFLEHYGAGFPELSRGQRLAQRQDREVDFALSHPDRPVFYTSRVSVESFPGCRLVPAGMLLQLLRPGEGPVQGAPLLSPLPPVDATDCLESMLAAGITYRAGLTSIANGNRDQATDRLLQSESYGRSLALIQLLLAQAYQDMGDRDAALRCLERALVIEPDNESALYTLATLHEGAAAVPYLRRLVQGGSPDVGAHLLYAAELVRQEDLSAASDVARDALSIAPDFDPTRQLLSAIESGERAGGADGLDQAQQKVESLRWSWMADLARAQLHAHQFERAVATLTSVVEHDPDNAQLLRSLGYALLQAQRLGEATLAFQRLLELQPQHPEAANALAYVYSIIGDQLETARGLAQDAMRGDESLRPYALDTLGWIEYRAGNLQAAITALREAAQLLPSSDASMRAENAYHQASVLEAMGDRVAARTMAEASRRGASDHFWTRDLELLESRLRQ